MDVTGCPRGTGALTTMDHASTTSRADAGTLTPISHPKRIPFAAEYSTEDSARSDGGLGTINALP